MWIQRTNSYLDILNLHLWKTYRDQNRHIQRGSKRRLMDINPNQIGRKIFHKTLIGWVQNENNINVRDRFISKLLVIRFPITRRHLDLLILNLTWFYLGGFNGRILLKTNRTRRKWKKINVGFLKFAVNYTVRVPHGLICTRTDREWRCWILDWFEWNKLRRTYVHFNNLFHSVVHSSTCCTSGWWSWNEMDGWNLHWLIYKRLNRLEKGWEVLWSQLTHKDWIELQLYEKLSLMRTNVWIAIPVCFAPNTFKCKLESLLTLNHSNCWRNLWMSFFQLATLDDKTERWINSILPIVSLWSISQQAAVQETGLTR